MNTNNYSKPFSAKQKRTFVLTLLLLAMSGSISFAQINYTRTTFTSAYTPITVGGGATQINLGTGLGDFSTTGGVASGTEGAAHIPLPFNFNYNGTLFTAGTNFIGICTNGYIYPTVGATNATKVISNVNTNLFTVTAPNITIAPYWDDLTIGTAINGTTGTVLFQTTGSVGSQVMTIQFTNVPAFSSGSVKALNFQVNLYETTNVIEFVYGPMNNGTALGAYNLSESASVGIEGSTGGNNNYIDGITGSKTANYSMMTSNKFTSLLNTRFTPGAPVAIAAGTYNVGVGQTYPSLSEAVADLNHRGISGAVTLNLTDAVYDSTAGGGKNIFPIVMSNIAGTSLANTILVDHAGTHADLRYRGTDAGNLGNQTSGTLVTTTFEPMLCLFGTDFVTFNNVDFTYNGVQGTAVSYNAAGKVDNSIGVMNSSATDGATNNTFQNFVCTNDRTGTGGGQAIRHFTQTAATSAAGANSNNTYRDFVIKNGTSGFLISGTAAFPDINNRIITSSCNTYNIIGDESVANDMQNPGLSTSPFGITMTNQSGFTVSNNKISNMTNMNTTSNIVDGINISLFQGTCVVSNNIIKNLRQNVATGTSVVTGIKMTNAITGIHEIRVYNNSVSNLTTAYAGAASTTRMIRGMSGLSTSNNTATYAIYNNSVSIDGSASPNASNNCFDIAGTVTTQPKYDVRNNIFANYTIAQGATAKHCCYFANSATLLGGTGTTVNQNDMWLANDGGVSGFIGQSSTIAGTFPVGTFNTTYATYVTAPNVSGDPGFFNIYSNLHASNSALLSGTGSVIPAYITTDLDCNARSAPNHIGAYLVNACPSGVPTVSVTPVGTSCTGTPLTATTSAALPQYQWVFNGVDIFGATSSTYTPGVTGNGTYTCRVNNTGESCFGISNSVVVNLSPTISVTPASAAVCDGQTVNINAAVTNNPQLTYTVASIPFAGMFAGALTNGAALPGGPGTTVGALGDEGNYNAPQNNLGVATDLPWNFNFYGRNYTKFTVHSNGQLLMGTSQTTANSVFSPPAIPGLAAPNNWAGFWADLSVNGAGQITWDVVGTTPARKFIVRWQNVDFFSATPFVTYQIELNETSHDIDVYLTSVNGITNTKAIGIEDTVVAGAVQGLAATGRNSGTWTATNEGWRFSQVPPPSYTYAWSPATDLSSTTIANPVCTPSTPFTSTTYTVTVTNVSNGCSVTATTSITNLGPADPAPTTIGDATCANESAHLEAAGLSTLNWYTAASGGTLIHSGTTWDSIWTATTTYYVESFNGNCPSPRTAVTVTVTALPSTTPTVSPNPICLGSSANLDAGTFLSGILSTPTTGTTNGSSATGFDITNTTASPITLHYFTFQSSSVAGTVGVQQIWMNTTPMNCVFPANVTTAPGWVQIANVSTTSAGNTGFPTTITYTTIPFDVNVTIPAGATYAFAVGGALGQSYFNGTSGCPIMGSTPHLTVKEGFGGTLTGTIAARRWIGTVTYQYGDPNLNFSWSPAAELNSATIKSPIATPVAAGPNPYTVTVTNLAGCTASASVTLNVTDIPLAPIAGLVTVPCGNGNATLNATAQGTGTLKWWTAASGGTQVGTGGTLIRPVYGDTTFYVSETTLAAPNCEGPRTAILVDIVDPDTINATVDIPLICDQAAGSVLVTLNVANTSSPQNNNYFYTWSAPGTGGLNATTGTTVTANPAASTYYVVTANQIGNLSVNINGVSPNGNTSQDEITWTLKDASNVTILSGGPYAGTNNNVTSLSVPSTNGPFTFQINAGNVLNDTNYAAFTVFCDGNAVASGCVKGSLNLNETGCLNIGTFSVPGINGCFGSCNRIDSVFVGFGLTPILDSVTTTLTTYCSGDSATLNIYAHAPGSATSTSFSGGAITINDATSASPYPSTIAVSGLPVAGTTVAYVQINGLTHTFPSDIDIVLESPTGQKVTMMSDQGGGTGVAGVNLVLQDGFPAIPAAIVSGTYKPTGDGTADNFNAPFVGSPWADPAAFMSTFSGNMNGTWNLWIMDDVGGDLGSITSWSITFNAPVAPLTYTWAPASGLSATNVKTPKASPSATTTYTATAFDASGCSVSSTITVNIVPTPPAPAVTGDVVCGPDTVNLSAVLSDPLNNLIWTDTIGGQIVNYGTTYNPYVTTSGSYYVHEIVPPPPSSSVNFGYTGGVAVGFFPDVASFMNFNVLNQEGIIINTVQVSTNLPAGTYPLVVALANSSGQIVSVHDTIFISGGSVALQTVTLDMYVPQGTGWRLQPIFNPNLSVDQNAAVTASVPSWTIPNQIQITCFGNASSACFATNTFGLFYNWNVSLACLSPASIVNYVVNDPPGMSVSSSNGLSFCDSISTVLSVFDSTGVYDTFEWSPATGLSATTGSSVSVSSLTSATYTVLAHDTVTGCNNIQTIDLVVNPAPTVLLSFHDTTVCVTQDSIHFNATAAKSSITQVGTRFNANFVNGQVYGGNTTQYSQMIFTPAELNAAGLVGPTNITSIAYYVASKLTTTNYIVDIKMRSDAGIPAAWPNANHINTGLTTVYNNPSIPSALGWNTYVFSTPFAWDGVSNVLVSQCFTHIIPGFFDVVSTSNSGAVRFNSLNAAACGAATGALAAVNPNDRPNVRFTGGNVTFSWSPATGLNPSSTVEDPTFATNSVPVNTTTTFVLTVTDPVSGCTAKDSVNVSVLSVPVAPISGGDVTRCGYGDVSLTATAVGGYTLRWFTDTTGGTLLGTGSPFIYTTGADDTLWVEEFNGGCAGPRTAVVITITPAPAVDVTGTNVPICDGNGPATLTATSTNPNYVYTWSPAPLAVSGANNEFATVNPATTTTYTVTGFDSGSGCQDTSVIVVGVGTSVTINAVTASTDTVCIGSSSTLTVVTPAPGAYSVSSIPFAPVVPITTPLSGVGPTGDEGTVLGAPLGFSFNFFGTNYSSVTIHTNGYVVFAPPAYVFGSFSPPAIPNVANTNSWAGFWADLNALAGNITYGTVGVAPFRKFVVNYNAVNYFSATPSESHQIILNETYNTIEVHQAHAQTTNTQAIGVENQTGTIGTAAPGRNAGIWSTDNEAWSFAPPVTTTFAWTPADGSLSSTTVSNPVATPLVTTTYTVTVTNAASGCTSTGTVTIEVLSVPTAPVVTGPLTNCGPAILTFTSDAGLPVDTVKWYNAPIGGTLLSIGDVYSPLVTATTTFYVERTNGTCSNAGGRTPFTITITTPPALSAGASPATICENDSTVLSVDALTVGNYNDYSWAPATGLSATTGASVNAAPSVTTTYTVFGINPPSGDPSCSNVAFVTVTVNPAPIITSTSVSPDPICPGGTANLNVIVASAGAPGTYTVTSIPHAPLTPTGPVTVLATGGVAVTPQTIASLDDGTWDNLPLPAGFAFNYYGTTPTTFSVSTNGFMTFGASGGAFCCSGQFLPNAGAPNNYLAMAHEDWLLSASGTLDYFTNGVAPFRQFVVRATAVPRFGGTGAPTTAQIVLNETLNTIEMHLTSVTAGAGDLTTQAIENPTGTSSTIVAGRNQTSWSATNEGWLFAPPVSATYSWSPAAGLSSSTVSNPTATVNATTPYTVVVTNSSTGCTISSVLTVNVTPAPQPYLSVGDTILCSNDPGFYMQVLDGGAYAGGWPLGTNFDFYGAGALLYQSGFDSTYYTTTSDAYYAVVTLPPGVGSCTGTSDTAVVDFGATQAPQYALTTDSVGCYGESTGNAIANIVFGGTPDFRWRWYDTYGTLLRDVTNSLLYDTLTGVPTGMYTLVLTDHQGVATPPYCQIIDSIFVGEPAAPLYVDEVLANHVDVQCYGYGTGAIDITASGGTGAYTYDWSNGSTDEDQTGLVAGVYTVTVSDERGCTYVFATEIIQNPQVTIGTAQSNVSCHNGFDGTATVYVDGGVPGYTYLWSDGQTTETAFNLSAGVYTVIITDNSGIPGCDTIMTFLISEPSLLDATGLVVDLNCYGASNGVATAFPFGGNPPYAYSWNSIPVQTTQTATGLTAGTIVCTITDSTGCTKDLVLQINQPDSFFFDQTVTDITCNGGSDGSITISVEGGTPGYTYLWSNGGTTQTISGLSAGSYIVTVTDANGCQVIGSIAVSQPSAINILTSQVDVTCNGLSNGSALATVSGGTAPYSYSWNSNPAQTTNSATGLPAGTYTVVVTDAAGCTASADVTITQPDAIALNENVTQPLCNGGLGSIELFTTGGTLPYTFIWSNGNTTEINGALTAGTYTVTVTDANGCVHTQTFVLSAPSAIVVTPTVTNVSCFGSVNGSVVLSVSGGVGPYTYQWSNGSTDNSISGLAAGNYTVTVTDANSCSVTVIVPVTQPAELTCICNSNVTNVSCFGGSNGSITALPIGGTAPYSYSWIRIAPTVSGVLATTQTISGLTAGTYQVTITDANGCVKVGIAVVTQPAQLVVTPTVTNSTCNGSSNGQIALTVTGGVPPYTYAWSTVPAQTTAIATGLTAGSYTAVVTDANGCSQTITATITQPAGITLTTSKTNVSCFGSANGTAKVTATGGVSPYTYLWSNGKTTKNITGLAAGTYTVTVTDANGCSATTTVVITQPSKITALYVVTNPTCFGSTNGAIDITVTGGTPSYTYLWSNGATTQDLAGIGAGAYSVLITDNKGCVILANIIVTQPKPLVLSTTVKNVKCFGGSTGKVTVSTTGGKSPYTFLWSNGATTSSANNLVAGTYTVTVTDKNGCTASTSATVTESPQLVCSANTACMSDVTCFGGNNGKLCVSVTGGLAPYTYLWNTNPVSTTASVNNVPAGTYTVIVTDKNGCTTSCVFVISQPAAPVTATVTGTNAGCFGGSNGTAAVVAAGGTAPYTYLWNTGAAATTDNISGLSAGIYTVTVTDANGCTGTGSITITQNSQVTLTATHTNLSCNGSGLGTITAVAAGGLSPYTYTLNPGAVSNGTGVFTGLTAGTYDVTVSDEEGCTAVVTGIVITEPAILTMDPPTGTDVSCFGGNNGTATAGAVSGGTPPYTYNWNSIPPQGTATATGLTAGTYIVMVTDAYGCTVSGTITINEPASPLAIAIINQTNITCSGGTTGDATADATGGTAPYTYLWSDGQTTATATGLASGTYVVTATDANGCQALTSVLISESNAFNVTAVATNVSCNGGSDGTITATVSGGNPPILYELNPGAITNATGIFTGLSQGNYTVTATDVGGCSASTAVSITEPSILIANATSTNVSCNGGSNGTATVYATGGTAPYSYSWTGGSSLQNPTGLAAGTYTVTVTDANGCTLERTVTITEPAVLAIAQSQVDVICNGGATGSATASVSGGTAPYFYFWSNGQMTPTAVGLTAGTYTVTVTDYKGCTAIAVYTIVEGSSIVANPAQGLITCYGGTTTISVAPTGGTAPYTYSWIHDAGNTTDNAVVGSGTYYVTITDASGCEFTQSFIVTEPSQVLCGAASSNITCNGANDGTASVTPSGGLAPYAYLWSNSATDASLTGLSAGTYTVIVTDVNGCSNVCSVTITEPDVLNLTLSNSNASCGTNNGSAMAIVSGGTPPYNYLWDDGQTTSSISGLAAGTYTVTVTDANGCGPQTASVTIGDTPPVSCSVTGVDPTCAGYNNGLATVTVSGGAGSETYSWNTAPIQTTITATGLAAGTYEVTVTDISGCSSTCSIEILEPSPLVLTASQSNNACSGGASGVATVNPFGGLPPYSYLWTNGQTTQTATGLSSGAVYVTVTDDAGCSAVLCVIMQQPVTMSCNTSTTPAACNQAIGTATVNVFGGQAPYSYNWNTIPQQTNAIATLLTAGTYTVTVTDANGCTTQCTAIVVQPGGVSYILSVVNPACNGGTGTIDIALLNGGTAPYTYAWSTGSTTANSGAVSAGTYTVTVTDANGCSNIQSATVTEPPALVVTTSQNNVDCNGNSNGSACVSAAGGTQPYTYAWSTGANSQCVNNLPAGTYTVTATDSHGCTVSAAVVITEPAVLDTISTVTTVASCGLDNGTATVNPTGGTGPYTYSWNTTPVQTDQTATGLPAGNNFVTITDDNGCSITICVKVPSSAGIGLSLASPVYAGGYNIRCNGGSDGSINLTVSGSGPFTYDWSNGATTEDLAGLSAGTYTVTVTNGGCTAVGSITLTEAPAWTVLATGINVTCYGGNNGSATVTVSGGTAPYSYSWNSTPVKTTQTATGLTAGTYIVTVSDANGCTQTAAVVITQPASGLSITANSVNPLCNGSSDGSIDITVTGGTPPYSFLWTGGAITEDRSGVAAGSHTVTVTDANGCTIALCVVLTQPTQIALTTSKTDVPCAGGSTGSASVTAAGGTPGYSYLWSNGVTTAANNNIPAGTYTVTVTDANGCIRNATVTINQAAPMVLSTTSTNVTVYGGNNGTASVTVVSGGTPAYSYSWNTVPVKTTSSVTGLTAGTYQVSVTDSKGCVKTATVIITQPNYNCSSGTPFRTETPSRWGSTSGTASTYLTANFSAAFPAGLVVGGGCGTGKTLTLTSATAVRNFEVNQSVSGSGTVLSANLTNPTSVTFPSALAANTVALKLNVTFDAYDPNFAPIPTVTLGNLIYNAAPFSGLTVNQILAEANKKLGGCSSPYTVSQFNTAIHNIDSAYKAGVTGPTASLLVCPAAHIGAQANVVETATGILAYPNPSTGVMNISFTADQDGKVIVNLLDVTGRLVWNIEENVFSGENVRTYNFDDMRKGVYFMQVTKDGRTDIVRIVLQ